MGLVTLINGKGQITIVSRQVAIMIVIDLQFQWLLRHHNHQGRVGFRIQGDPFGYAGRGAKLEAQ